MALPKPQLSIFTLIIPSTKKKIKFRQFTVKEEKLLAQAEQSEDIEIMTNAITGIISSCCQGIDNLNDLALFDIEYIMTKIRAKSVGEKIDLTMKCDVDENHRPIPARIDLDTIEVTFPEGHDKKIVLFDDVGVVMKYPSFGQIDSLQNLGEIETIAACIDYVYSGEEIFYSKEQTEEELVEFLEGLTKSQLEKIQEVFFVKMPKYVHTLKYTCFDCGHEHTKEIRGISSFFV